MQNPSDEPTPICRNTSPLGGFACTNMCEFRNDCTVPRIPLLTPVIKMKVNQCGDMKFKTEPFPVWGSGKIKEGTMFLQDAEVNESIYNKG